MEKEKVLTDICGDMKGVKTYRYSSINYGKIWDGKKPQPKELCRKRFWRDPGTE